MEDFAAIVLAAIPDAIFTIVVWEGLKRAARHFRII